MGALKEFQGNCIDNHHLAVVLVVVVSSTIAIIAICSEATATLGSTPQHGNPHMGVVTAWFKFTSQFQC